jgi:hypothetical protein
MSFMNTGAVRGRPDPRKNADDSTAPKRAEPGEVLAGEGFDLAETDTYDWLLVMFSSLGDKAL